MGDSEKTLMVLVMVMVVTWPFVVGFTGYFIYDYIKAVRPLIEDTRERCVAIGTMSRDALILNEYIKGNMSKRRQRKTKVANK